jgi:fructan beta-fructosidase
VDFWAYFTVEAYKGRPAVVSVSDAPARGFSLIRQSDEIPGQDKFYTESLRPQLRFSQKVGWNNDTNGMVYHDGEWHLFFQYCPVALRHADKFWGHAVSRDLIHWEELPIALYPFTQAKGQCFSGSAVVDHNNTAGFQTGDKPPIVAVFSDFGSGVGEALAYSNDRGRTFTYYEGNPVLKHPGNDPKVIWYEYGKNDQPISDEAKKLGGHWVMAVYDGKREYGKNIAFYSSTDLKNWTERSHLPGYAECPELLELPVDLSPSNDSAGTSGDTRNTRWVVFAADAQYAVGQFDGKVFTPEHEGKHRVHYGAYFASQTFNNPPDGRTIQIGWARINLPGMPFNQAFTFPHRLTLRRTPDGIRMFAVPIEEIAKLRKKTHSAGSAELAPDAPKSVAVSGELFEIRAEFALGQAKSVGLDIGGNRVAYDVAAKKLNGAPMAPVAGKVSMHVIVDRPMIEICGNDGAVYITSSRGKRGDVSAVKAFADGGAANLVSMEIHELESIWSVMK